MSSTPKHSRPHDNRQRHGDWAWHVGIGLAVPILAMLMTINEDGTVALAFLPDYPLPMVCLIRKHFHIDCLTCGMTRSVILLAQGRLQQSFAQHSLGWLALLLVLLQIPYGIQLRLRGRDAWQPSKSLVLIFWTILLAALIIVRIEKW